MTGLPLFRWARSCTEYCLYVQLSSFTDRSVSRCCDSFDVGVSSSDISELRACQKRGGSSSDAEFRWTAAAGGKRIRRHICGGGCRVSEGRGVWSNASAKQFRGWRQMTIAGSDHALTTAADHAPPVDNVLSSLLTTGVGYPLCRTSVAITCPIFYLSVEKPGFLGCHLQPHIQCVPQKKRIAYLYCDWTVDRLRAYVREGRRRSLRTLTVIASDTLMLINWYRYCFQLLFRDSVVYSKLLLNIAGNRTPFQTFQGSAAVMYRRDRQFINRLV